MPAHGRADLTGFTCDIAEMKQHLSWRAVQQPGGARPDRLLTKEPRKAGFQRDKIADDKRFVTVLTRFNIGIALRMLSTGVPNAHPGGPC